MKLHELRPLGRRAPQGQACRPWHRAPASARRPAGAKRARRSRSGGSKGPGFEGGQTPLQRRLPKRGFNNVPFKREYAVRQRGGAEPV